jgi:LPXTG-motif cell wall-anchored protein
VPTSTQDEDCNELPPGECVPTSTQDEDCKELPPGECVPTDGEPCVETPPGTPPGTNRPPAVLGAEAALPPAAVAGVQAAAVLPATGLGVGTEMLALAGVVLVGAGALTMGARRRQLKG